MGLKYMLILTRDKNEIVHRFDASTPEEAAAKAETLIRDEWKKRQETFPFTPESPAETTLFRELSDWRK